MYQPINARFTRILQGRPARASVRPNLRCAPAPPPPYPPPPPRSPLTPNTPTPAPLPHPTHPTLPLPLPPPPTPPPWRWSSRPAPRTARRCSTRRRSFAGTRRLEGRGGVLAHLSRGENATGGGWFVCWFKGKRCFCLNIFFQKRCGMSCWLQFRRRPAWEGQRCLLGAATLVS